jgi:hypothetical protein
MMKANTASQKKANGEVPHALGPAPLTNQPQTVQLNPVETAQVALMFLSRADFKAAERVAFDRCEMLLQAIAQGRVVLAPPPGQEGSAPEALPPPV